LELGAIEEACSLGLAPSTTTTAMMALGDALALVTSRRRNFRAEDFARFHPGGSLGRKLSHVEDHMRPISESRVAVENCTVREVFTQHARPGRRSGAIMLVSSEGRLRGIFTDSDLARLFESHRDGALDRPIRDVMTSQPTTIVTGSRMNEALRLFAERKISELPVVDAAGTPTGLIDITDLAGMLPEAQQAAATAGHDVTTASPVTSVRLFPKQEDSDQDD
jgi:arabinose-5-phosphate isomerase